MNVRAEHVTYITFLSSGKSNINHSAKRKIGFRLSGFRQKRLNGALTVLAQIGYDGVELTLEHPELNPDFVGRWEAKKLINYLNDINLKASAVSFHGKRAGWEMKRLNCIAGIQLAHDLGVGTFISSSCLGEGQEKFAEMCSFTEDMCLVADKLGVDFAVEPEPGTLINGTTEMSALMETVDSDRLKINLDVGHSYLTEGDVRADILHWGSLITHTHIEDIKGGEHSHLLPGAGELNFKSILSAFDQIDYSGFFTLDLFDIQDNPEDFARKGIEALWQMING